MGIWNLKKLARDLAQKSIATDREAGSLAGWIWEEIFGYGKHAEQQLDASDEEKLDKILDRLAAGEPIQYIAGHAWFYGLKLKVNPAVLIPRPETEELVEWVIHDFRHQSKVLRILDIGTGSGCMAIALKHFFRENAQVVAIDNSPEALEVAKANAQSCGVAIQFLHHDFLAFQFRSLGTFDVIVSNPPYVDPSKIHEDQLAALAFEPTEALFPVSSDPDIFYKVIMGEGKAHLEPSGACYVEINEFRSNSMKALVEKYPWKGWEMRKDLQGRDRMLKVF